VGILLIFETAVATLSGTYIGPPGTLSCGLDERWRYLFQGKHADSIQRIQNAFECCGLHSPRDKAYPFPSHDVGIDACQRRYDRTKSCFADWKAEEQLVAGLMLLAVFLVFVWKVSGKITVKGDSGIDVVCRAWLSSGRPEIPHGWPAIGTMGRILKSKMRVAACWATVTTTKKSTVCWSARPMTTKKEL
jgi:hypothetical protein